MLLGTEKKPGGTVNAIAPYLHPKLMNGISLCSSVYGEYMKAEGILEPLGVISVG